MGQSMNSAAEGASRMLTRIVSFGFKYGTPADADVVLDVRFLENPYFVPELKHLPGTDRRVADFVLGLAEARTFLEKTRDLLTFMMPRYEREGKSYLTIAIGCTGGRHRSVALAEALAGELTRGPGQPVVTIAHRDVARGDASKYSQREGTLENDAVGERLSYIELMGAITAPPPTVASGPPARPRRGKS